MSSSSGSSHSSPMTRPASPIASAHYSLHNPRTVDVFQSIVKARKSWKSLKGGEVVWPPELEAALIEGLENYQPNDSRETRLLGRFPLRNRFISEWIYQKTGKRRTAKQVGSRLQQLRDKCRANIGDTCRASRGDTRRAKRVLSLLSPLQLERPHRSTSLSPEFHYRDDLPPFLCESESGSDSSTSTPGTPIETHANLQSLLYRGVESREKMPTNIIYIDLLRPGSSIDDDGPFWTSPSQVTEERSLAEHGCRIIRATEYPRHLRDIDPTITLLSQSTSNARSHFTVHLRDRLMFSESTKLELVDPSTSNVDGFLYKTLLVPGYWDTISQSPDASQYTITQRVVQDSCSISSPPSMIFSAVYKFLYQTSTPTVENFAISHMLTAEPHVQNEEFCLDDLLTMDAFSDALSDALSDTEAYTDIMAFVKPPDFFDEVEMDFTLESLESEQCSPDHSAFSSPGQYPQLVDVVPDELLLPASSFEFRVDTPNYL